MLWINACNACDEEIGVREIKLVAERHCGDRACCIGEAHGRRHMAEAFGCAIDLRIFRAQARQFQLLRELLAFQPWLGFFAKHGDDHDLWRNGFGTLSECRCCCEHRQRGRSKGEIAER